MSDTISRRGATVGEFAELICADPAWLHAEFEAIVAASFSEVPLRGDQPRPRSTPRAERQRTTSVWRAWPPEHRERSPPMPSGSTTAATS